MLERDSKLLYKHAMETFYTEGYIFGKELDDYILYTVRATPNIAKKYDENEIVDAVLDKIYKKYEKTQIGICKRCNNVKKTVRQWGKGFEEKICLQCKRAIEMER